MATQQLVLFMRNNLQELRKWVNWQVTCLVLLWCGKETDPALHQIFAVRAVTMGSRPSLCPPPKTSQDSPRRRPSQQTVFRRTECEDSSFAPFCWH